MRVLAIVEASVCPTIALRELCSNYLSVSSMKISKHFMWMGRVCRLP